MAIENLVGQTMGLWMVVREIPRHEKPELNRGCYYLCVCTGCNKESAKNTNQLNVAQALSAGCQACGATKRRGQKRALKQLVCAICGNGYQGTGMRPRHLLYCSACGPIRRFEWEREYRLSKRTPAVCARCGKDFLRHPRNKTKLCSLVCVQAWSKENPVIVTRQCDSCESAFEASSNRSAKYCSYKCRCRARKQRWETRQMERELAIVQQRSQA